MGEPGKMDDLFAGAQRVEAEPHTARRAIGLGTALVATGATVALIVSGTAYGLWVGFWSLAIGAWQH
ncbi:hypothetical protein [Curtobacterium sp. ER1/6]|uniref:hypothetical protein n=1 Tax=Curtobacterium sp. ER1/6 TaxID=1891920 RepID=UPI00114D08D6|nr:hypothetical protein [Curtobacterium sp. ER1/6]